MPIYATLLKMTPEGAKGLDQATERNRENLKLVESKGGKVIGLYALLGDWDFLAIIDFPNEKSAMSALLGVAKRGRLTSKTMPAIPIEEFLVLAKEA